MRAIDVKHLGRERVISCWEVDGLIVDPGPESSLHNLLDGLGDQEPRAMLLTHIHLDHAGGAGALVRRFPHLPVYVHERGAQHLKDPSKLIASASQLYSNMEERWGEIVPVPEENIRVLQDGDSVEGFRVAYTPGHASHHVAFLHEDSGRAFVGDVAGVTIPPSSYVLMPTPPPDIDVAAWHASIDRVGAWQPIELALTHFAVAADVGAQLEAAHERLASWAELARSTDADGFLERITREIADGAGDPQLAAAYLQASPADLMYLGLERYWSKSEAKADGATHPYHAA